MFWHASKEKRGFRAWWHFGDSPRHTAKLEAYWWSHHCHLSFEIDDEGAGFSIALPPLAVYLNIPWPQFLTPQRKHIATWDGGREVWLTNERECGLAIHDWTIQLKPWCKVGDWVRDDPWWVRGVSLDIKDFFLGKAKYSTETLDEFRISVPLPEASYAGTVQVERRIWKRPRWRKMERVDASVRMDGCMPFLGKGENSWDCGMDGLCGYGCSSVKPEDIIAEGVRSVLASRKRRAGSINWVPPAGVIA